ncbi:MAG: M48 family metalloprotease [Nibricoccus sp.]
MKRGTLILLAGIWLLLAHTNIAVARDRDMKREAAHEKKLAEIAPDAVPAFHSATAALDKDNYAEAEALFRIVLTKAPHFDVALRRLGACLVQLGKKEEGLRYCAQAVESNRTADNLTSYAYNLMLSPDPNNARANQQYALSLVGEARRLPDADQRDILGITAQLALQLRDESEFRGAVAALQSQYPDQMGTHYFSAILAAMDEHWMQAEDEILNAEKMGLPHETVQRFLDSGIHSNAFGWRLAARAGWTTVIWIVGLAALFSTGFVLSKMTLKQAGKADVRFTVNPGEHWLRRIYRSVINVAGVYYYISLPIIVVLVIGLAGAIFYAFLSIGRIPIKLMLLLGFGALATVYSLIKSLFVRVKSEDPGRALTREEAEELWKLTDEVARTVNTRPIDEIRITTGTELAVYERGTWRDKMRNKATRILILGVGVLKDFKIDDFRAVLAHEYGHFSNRDTAGGDIALRVQNDMLKFYYAMYEAGQATYYNVAFHFLRLYNFIFRRISHGATRLQEILADRVAAQCYGAAAFEGGLRHVIRRSIEFHRNADIEINASIQAKRPLANLYEWRVENDAPLEKEYEQSINRETTEDDTHPSPKDRFRLVAAVNAPSCAPRSGQVWDLFRDREVLMKEMMAKIEKNVAHHRQRGDETGAAPAQPNETKA